MSDADCAAATAATAVRDPGAFIAAHLDSLVRTAYLLVGSHESAEDLVMDAVSKCLPRWHAITGDPSTYVGTAMLHSYFSTLRRLRLVRETPTAVLPDTVQRDQHDGVVLRADLLAALSLLPRRQRAVIVLRYLDDMSNRQIAQVLQVSEGTVRSHTHDALAALRIGAPKTLLSNFAATSEHENPVTQ